MFNYHLELFSDSDTTALLHQLLLLPTISESHGLFSSHTSSYFLLLSCYLCLTFSSSVPSIPDLPPTTFFLYKMVAYFYYVMETRGFLGFLYLWFTGYKFFEDEVE